MFVDVEETLSRELHEVADGLHIPAMPPLAQAAPPRRHWQPLLVAAAVVLIVAGGGRRGGDHCETIRSWSLRRRRPAGPVDRVDVRIPTKRAESPVRAQPAVVRRRRAGARHLVVGDAGDAGWVAHRRDDTWWWGRGPKPNEITGYHDGPPVISPNGTVRRRDPQGERRGRADRAWTPGPAVRGWVASPSTS